MPNSENNCPSNCYCNSQENVNENNTKFEQDSLDEIKEIDFKFDSPGGKRKENKSNGKNEMITSFKSRYNKTDILSDNEQIEKQRMNDEEEIEMEFIGYHTEREYQKPERIGPDGNRRRYLIDKMEKKND